MPTEIWKREIVHSPQMGVPIASDSEVTVALAIDNVGNAPALGLMWQQVNTPKREEWSWIGDGSLWALFENNRTNYTHSDGTKKNGTRKEVQKVYGDRMIFDWIPEMNRRLKAFFGTAAAPTIDPLSIDALIAAMKTLEFEGGQVVKK
mgnify:CR=1 FL=1